MDKIDKLKQKTMPSHIAIILDGNGRWAKKRGRSRSYGHRQGALNVKHIVEVCKKLGVSVLSVYAFSTENWKRPKNEVDFLMNLPKSFEERYSEKELDEKVKLKDVRVVFSGRRDRFNAYNVDLIERIEKNTAHNEALTLNICVDYGSRDEIVHATKVLAQKVKNDELAVSDIDAGLFEKQLYTKDLPPVDLLIRTSGEIRLSNYLLWQNAYAEFYFTKTHWPAFKEKQLIKAIEDYQKRNRKFGEIKE